MVFDELKAKSEALKITLDCQSRDEKFLNNMLCDLKEKYSIENSDWLKISVAFSVLTSREVISKFR
jgi:hypothetical protein